MRGVDCRNWDEDAYKNSILQERERHCRTVFRTAFPPSPDLNSNADLIVAASSDGSVASYSISSCLSTSPQLSVGNGRGRTGSLVLAEPRCFLRGHDGPAYDVKFYGDTEDSLLLSCGDDGRIQGWSWKEILTTEHHISLPGGHLKPVLDLVNPQYNFLGVCFCENLTYGGNGQWPLNGRKRDNRFDAVHVIRGPWGALSPIPENNAIAVDNQGGSIFAAAGDSCAYCWDVEKSEIKMVFKGHSDYLHCIVARNSGNQIITGSEDGTARIWDCRSGKCIQVIDPQKDKKLKEHVPFVSCIALDASESWLACGSGRTLTVWNLPARECISKLSIRAPVQDMFFDDNQILAVGSEPLLSRFDMNGITHSQIQCAPLSAFSISLHPSGITAVAGYGGLVDVISQFGSHLCTFHCKSL